MISVAALTATALTGGHAFPKLSPLTSPMRIHSTFQDGGAGAKLALDRLDASAKDCAAAVQGSGCRSRGGNIKMQAVAAGAATMSVAQACAFMQDPSLSGMTVEAKLEFLATKGIDAFVGSQASCTSLGMYTSFGPVTGGDAAPAAAAAAPAAAAPVAAAAAAPAKVERFSDPSKGLSPVDVPYPTAMLEAMGGYDVETGGGIWDPLRLAAAPEADLKWYRQAEIKHGRVAMLACVGYAAAKAGLVFQGAISRDGTTFAAIAADAGTNPFAEWALVPLGGKIQATLAAAAIELSGEQKAIEGGKVGELPILKAWLPWIPRGEAQDAETQRKREVSLLSELKNGRLAMIGIAGFYASETIPGSVPFHF